MTRCRRFDDWNATRPEVPADHQLQAHVAECRTCAALLPLRRLEKEALHLSRPGFDDVAVRRLRQRLLEDLAAGAPVPLKRRVFRRGFAVAVGLVAASAVIVAFWARPVKTGAPHFVATVIPSDSVTARWSQRLLAGREEIRLEEGTFRMKVTDHPTDRQVVFRLPDGEIEDLGTVFDVVVLAGQTRRVAVESGQVALRLRGATPVSLSSGALWNQSVDITPPIAEANLSPSLPPPVPPALAHRSRRAPAISSPPARSPTPPGVLSESEDVAYLHVVQLVRTSRMAEARIAAALYLRRFPRGFRTDEMRELVNK